MGEDMNEENEEFSKLKDITVTLVPYRDSEMCQNKDDYDPNMTNMSSNTYICCNSLIFE